ncbi:MAG: homoserine kinase, partial [Gammaproteobacteria bacterium]|nr:homoserine kinase [Gammaproteobacteria bacterium]
VLTLYESLSHKQLPFFLQLMRNLSAQGLAIPCPIPSLDGEILSSLQRKPAALFNRLPGSSVELPNLQQCQTIGQHLARLHLATEHQQTLPSNPRGYSWWKAIAPQLMDKLPPHEQALLQQELAFQSRYHLTDLPRGLIHADLFRDNALFAGDALSGILDLYAACEGSWLYDLAIVVIDWTSQKGPFPDVELSHAILKAYGLIRPLSALEKGAWPVVLRQAALRFWLSRLMEWHSPRQGTLIQAKDPDVFALRLAEFVKNEPRLRDLWPGD